MSSPFWSYFSDRLKWAPILSPGPIQCIAKGIAHRMDGIKADALFMRDQWFPSKCAPEYVSEHGVSRGIIRHVTESPEKYRQRVVTAWLWHMLGGKTEGLPQILKFYGFDILEIESMSKYQPSRWAEFQIGLHSPQVNTGQNTFLDDLETLVWLINEYKPARSIMRRMYTDVYNIKPLIWSQGHYSQNYYSGFSGVPASELGPEWNTDGDLILSFGMRHTVKTEPLELEANAHFGGFGRCGFTTSYKRAPYWSQFRYGDAFPPAPYFGVQESYTFMLCEAAPTENGRPRPDVRAGVSNISRSQLVYGDWWTRHNPDAGLWGSLNANYGVPIATIIDNSPVWGNYRYSGNIGKREVAIHEQTTARHSIRTLAPEESPASIAFNTTTTASAGFSPLHEHRWQGVWDQRSWYGYTAFFNTQALEEGE